MLGFFYIIPHLLRLIDPKVSQVQVTKYYYTSDLFSYNMWLGIFALLMCIIFLFIGVTMVKIVARYL
jgi:hypothetical protein